MRGVPVSPSRLTRAYNEGRSSPLPAGIVLNVGKRRINRKLGFSDVEISKLQRHWTATMRSASSWQIRTVFAPASFDGFEHDVEPLFEVSKDVVVVH